MSQAPDPVRLTADLVRCPSVTPEEAGAIRLLVSVLGDAGFTCFPADRGRVSNLVARWGPKGHPRTFGFNGHIDVVPPGDPADWSVDPFGAEVKDGFLWGRGATDMKSGVAAFVAAAADFVRRTPPDGAVIITVTGDEEGDATDGTSAILDWMEAEGERMTHCLVGEPTCPDRIGEAVKIGRRGSMNLRFKATGVQGHAAYPERAANPVPVLVALLHRLATATLDRGTGHFDASTVAITTFDTGNEASNVIPASCRAAVNIRFNDAHSSTSLRDWVAGEIAAVIEGTGVTVEVEAKVSGESFLTPPGEFSDLVGRAILAETGVTPALSTSGGTSDARFIRAHCPVVEFGLVGRTMHEVDERVEVEQIKTLTTIYGRILAEYFGV